MFIFGFGAGILASIVTVFLVLHSSIMEEERQEKEFSKLYKERYPDRPLPKKI